MSKNKKFHRFKAGIIAVVASALTVAPIMADAEVSGFPDVSKDNDHYESIMKLKNARIIKGDHGEFKPYESITRVQVAAILTKALNLKIPDGV
ncbi:S-layer homology domain-containing protein [Virgibacillus halodenitrificans]|nr:S-layer homology domain-containing protein [Virgibacillus halodenitrificans]MCG1027015.1 S-layer homology domain-containing protein [Virgibacillus halodenitrificans]